MHDAVRPRRRLHKRSLRLGRRAAGLRGASPADPRPPRPPPSAHAASDPRDIPGGRPVPRISGYRLPHLTRRPPAHPPPPPRPPTADPPPRPPAPPPPIIAPRRRTSRAAVRPAPPLTPAHIVPSPAALPLQESAADMAPGRCPARPGARGRRSRGAPSAAAAERGLRIAWGRAFTGAGGGGGGGGEGGKKPGGGRPALALREAAWARCGPYHGPGRIPGFGPWPYRGRAVSRAGRGYRGRGLMTSAATARRVTARDLIPDIRVGPEIVPRSRRSIGDRGDPPLAGRGNT